MTRTETPPDTFVYRGHSFMSGPGDPALPITAENFRSIFAGVQAEFTFHYACLLAGPEGATLLVFPEKTNLGVMVVDGDPTNLEHRPTLSIQKVRQSSMTQQDAVETLSWARAQLEAHFLTLIPEWLERAPNGVIVQMDDGRYAVRDAGEWHLMSMLPLPSPIEEVDLPVSIGSNIFCPVPMLLGTPEGP